MITGDFESAGTDSRVSLVMCGENGESPQFELTSETQKALFSRGAFSNFTIRTANLGDITHIRISRDGSGSMPGWFLKRVIIEDPSKPRCYFVFHCNDWITLAEEHEPRPLHVLQRQQSKSYRGKPKLRMLKLLNVLSSWLKDG